MKFIVLALGLLAFAAPALSDEIWTLYRTPASEAMRIHVATFDATCELDGYNRGNCEMVDRYLTEGEKVRGGRYWCESGRYRAGPVNPLQHLGSDD